MTKVFSFVLVLLLLVWCSTAHGSSYNLHPEGYSHLDCSACIRVADAIGQVMNDSLREGPGAYLTSHRLDKENKLARQQYKGSDVFLAEVLESICKDVHYSHYKLRMNPMSKVRGYHILYYREFLRGVERATLKERVTYLPNFTTDIDSNTSMLTMAPLASFYSTSESAKLKYFNDRAPGMMCTTLVEHLEEELENIIRYADYLWQLEEKICGLEVEPWFPSEADASSSQLNAKVPKPLTNLCSTKGTTLVRDVERDQKRFKVYTQLTKEKEERLKAKEDEAKVRFSEVNQTTEKADGKEDEGDL